MYIIIVFIIITYVFKLLYTIQIMIRHIMIQAVDLQIIICIMLVYNVIYNIILYDVCIL